MIRLIHTLKWLAGAPVLLISACSDVAAPATQVAQSASEISSTDFALRPCGQADAEYGCALLMAGGKRVLLGAPSGVRQGLDRSDLKNLDAVLLFSLRGGDMDGLGAVRNDSWLAGRNEPLRVTGPLGIADVVTALNSAYEASDAFAYVEKGASGGFSAAVLTSQRGEGELFNTGDLVISGREDSTGRMGYTVNYNNMALQVLPCGHDANGKFEAREGVFVLDCESEALRWPLMDTVMITGDPAITN